MNEDKNFSLRQKHPPLNVVFITIDSLRADHLSCYGYKRDTSPNIDKLAKEGVIFTQAISPATITPVSLYSIFTSLYPYTHGVIDWGSFLNSSIPALPQILMNKGYYTKSIIHHGIPEIVYKSLGVNRDFKESKIEVDTADKLIDEAIKFIIRKRRPFFLYLHHFDTHWPYHSPTPYNKIFLNDELYYVKDKNLPISNFNYFGYKAIPKILIEGNITNVNYYISHYDGAIRFVDEEIGRLLDKLKKLELYKNTLIIISADHGESFGEHNIYFHHGSLFDTELRVPLIMAGGNIFPQGKTINAQVTLIDIMPTIFDILGIEKPKGIEGISLLPLILGKEEYPRTFVFSGFKGMASIRTKEWKLIRFEPKKTLELGKQIPELAEFIENRFLRGGNQNPILYALCNLKENPKELNCLIFKDNKDDVVIKEKEKFTFLKEKLDNWIEQQPIAPPKEIPFSEELKEKLRSLGYLH
jgi:arylsulfatase A-like enzyme